MDLAQIRLAESFPGLVGNFFVPPQRDHADAAPEVEEERDYELADLFQQAHGQWNNACKRLNGSELHKALLTLQDTMNTSTDTAVRVGKIRMTDDAITCVDGEAITLPISLEKAELLYKKLDPSLVGVENRGDVLDVSLRRSHEAPAEVLSVSERIASFDFPEELREIHQQLCPSAVTIRAELYKFVIYGKNDFFVPHRDSMSSPEMFGSISVQIPVVCPHNEESGPNVHTKSSSDREHKNDTKRSGQLVFYVGRHLSDAETKTPSTCSYDDYSAEKRFAYVVDMEGLGTASMEGGAIAVPYGAWTGDVLHEVRRVESGYRAVLIYRLYKEGHRYSYIPRALRETASNQLSRLMGLLAEIKPDAGNSPFPEPLRYVGVILRHAYPPAGLNWRYLKGIDAVLYSIASETNRCLLFNAYAAHEGDFSLKHSVDRENFKRTVFLTAGAQEENFSRVDFYENMAGKYKAFGGAAWMQLGFGTLTGGGYCYGNADCGTEWWYRSAVMIITPEPSTLKRCRNLLLAVKKGGKGICRLGGNIQVLETISSFL